MPVMDHEIKRLELRIRWVAAVHGLAFVADDHFFHDAPDDVVEDRDAEEGEAVGPWNEDRAGDDEGDAGPAVEVLLKVELFVSARGAVVDDGVFRRRNNAVGD